MFNIFKKTPVAEDSSSTKPATEPILEPNAKPSFSERLKQSLTKTRKQFGNQLASLFGGGKIDAEVYEELETILLTSDVGVNATQNLLADLKNRVKRQNLDDTTQLKVALKEALSDLLTPTSEVSKIVSSSSYTSASILPPPNKLAS